MADRDGLLRHLKAAHAFIEETDAFGYAASHGILECAGSIWNIDESKAAIAAYEASPHPAASDEWKQAVDDELVLMQSTADSYPTPKDAIRDLIGFHVDVATNPQCNGGYSLQPAASDVRDEADRICKQASYAAQSHRTECEKEGDKVRANYWMGYADGAAVCARAIRALQSTPAGQADEGSK